MHSLFFCADSCVRHPLARLKSLLKKVETDQDFQKAIYDRLHPKKQEDSGFAFA